jgi:HTH-type transcriptional regulator/antitoxin HigA
MSACSSPVDKKYRALLASTLPRIIQTEQENGRYITVLEALHDRTSLTPEEEQLSGPIEVIRELMAANSLKQADMVTVFGGKSIVSEVLNGKRDLSKTHIQKLSQLFHVSPELFFAPRFVG